MIISLTGSGGDHVEHSGCPLAYYKFCVNSARGLPYQLDPDKFGGV